MTLKIPTGAQVSELSDMLGLTTPAALTLKLFTNNYTPVAASITSSFTEMSGQSYAAKTLAMASWSVSNVSGTAVATYAAQTWTFTAGGPTTIYGYYVIGADGNLRWAEQFAVPFVAQYSGDSITLTPELTYVSEF